MTPDEYTQALKRIGLSKSATGRFFGVTDVTGRRWARIGPPGTVAKLLRFMMALELSADYVDRMIERDGRRP